MEMIIRTYFNRDNGEFKKFIFLKNKRYIEYKYSLWFSCYDYLAIYSTKEERILFKDSPYFRKEIIKYKYQCYSKKFEVFLEKGLVEFNLY